MLANERGRLRGLRLALLMSHLVASEEPDNPINGEQLSRFRSLRAAPCRARRPRSPTPPASSSGPTTTSTCCGPGAALYGINPAARPAQSDAAGGDAARTHPAGPSN